MEFRPEYLLCVQSIPVAVSGILFLLFPSWGRLGDVPAMAIMED